MYLTKTAAKTLANRLYREGQLVAVYRERKNYTSGHLYLVLYGAQLAAIETFTAIAASAV